MQDENKNRKLLIKTLGNIIEKHRKSIGKSMYMISLESCISKSTWREAEYGICKDINLSTLWKISEALETSPGDLLNEIKDILGEDFSLLEI